MRNHDSVSRIDKTVVQPAEPQKDCCLFEVRDAVVKRSGHTILSVESLKVFTGEQVAVLGPNGAGKSTLIKLFTHEILPLYREQPPVLFCGKARPLTEEVRRSVGIVSATMQDQIHVHLSALDIVLGGFYGSLGVPMRAMPTQAMVEQAYDFLVQMGVGEKADCDICTLSTGQARRVLIARALVAHPKMLVFDEPCAGLDPEGAYHVRKAIGTLVEAGTSILLVTHMIEDIHPSISRVLLMKEGRIIADGHKETLLTPEMLTEVFHVPLQVLQSNDGIYHVW